MSENKTISIDKFIEIVHSRLPLPTINTHDHIAGSDLKLTGVKNVEGQKIQDHKIYKVLHKAPIKDWDHKKKIRLAWLRGGKPAVGKYLNQFLDHDIVKQLISKI
jgi:hypothetical protein